MQREEMSAGNVLTVFFSIVMGGMAIGQASPSVTAFAVGSSFPSLFYVMYGTRFTQLRKPCGA